MAVYAIYSYEIQEGSRSLFYKDTGTRAIDMSNEIVNNILNDGLTVVGKKKKEEHTRQELFVVPEKFNRKKPIYINEKNIRQYIFPDCCHPIPGDDTLGYIDNRNRIELHKRTCPIANKLKASFGNRILDVKWDMHKTMFFDATIRLGGIDRRGLVNEVTTIISNQMSVDIRKLTFNTEDGIFDGVIDLRVHDRDDVAEIIDRLKEVDDLKEISQIM